MKVAIINGPNLNLLGTREKEIYGDQSFKDYFLELKTRYDIDLEYFQSNIEGELINRLQELNCDGIVLNAGGYTHTSVSLRDCIAAIKTPVVEVHISNIASRESFRHESLISPVCAGCIFGFGMRGYDLALDFFISK
tara:strand:- start:5633 stop:6043 length:411 start_codon:yes stop_codon:yes gene_type:complete